jgi:hypothetical protein
MKEGIKVTKIVKGRKVRKQERMKEGKEEGWKERSLTVWPICFSRSLPTALRVI